eukprot:TRINITY_DN5620_c0_g1_i1.p2 TRINITY_DN5620_c0_g1~~TRINITY_DN5620_c0_g1_i1.p2  ORF type:complete len:147 (-),score=20.75 TRINITY_DN5620_c0_g1_i1:245-685(-)
MNLTLFPAMIELKYIDTKTRGDRKNEKTLKHSKSPKNRIHRHKKNHESKISENSIADHHAIAGVISPSDNTPPHKTSTRPQNTLKALENGEIPELYLNLPENQLAFLKKAFTMFGKGEEGKKDRTQIADDVAMAVTEAVWRRSWWW